MNFGEILFLFVLALLVFGPRKLPEIARLVGKTMAELRRASNEFRFSLEEEIRNAELQDQARKAAVTFTPSPAVPNAAPPALEAGGEPETQEATEPTTAYGNYEAERASSTPETGVPGTVPAPADPWPAARHEDEPRD